MGTTACEAVGWPCQPLGFESLALHAVTRLDLDLCGAGALARHCQDYHRGTETKRTKEGKARLRPCLFCRVKISEVGVIPSGAVFHAERAISPASPTGLELKMQASSSRHSIQSLVDNRDGGFLIVSVWQTSFSITKAPSHSRGFRSLGTWFPPFATNAKDGAPTVGMVSASSNS